MIHEQTIQEETIDAPANPQTQRIFIVFNPVAGTTPPEQILAAFKQYFEGDGRSYDVYETTGQESVEQITRDALTRGYTLLVAAGGDGTIAGVANALIGTQIPLGIVPAGTANVLAKELNIPVDFEAACRLLIGEHRITSIDAMQVADRCFFVQIDIGLGAQIVHETPRQSKQRFGILAYIWGGLTRLAGYQPNRFTIVADGKRQRSGAAEVVIANGGIFGFSPLRWGQHIHLDDGIIDVCIVGARTLPDYLNILWHMLLRQPGRSRQVRYMTARESIIVHADTPLPVQADGEALETTPVQVRVVPAAVQVIVPADNGA